MFRPTLVFLVVVIIIPFGRATEVDPALRNTIKQKHQDYLQALKDGNAEAYAAQFAQHAIILRPSQPLLQGRDSILRDQQAILERVTVIDGAIQSIHLDQSGDMAYEIGNFSYTIKVDGQGSQTVGGKFLAVWQRQGDGTWLRVAEAGLPQ